MERIRAAVKKEERGREKGERGRGNRKGRAKKREESGREEARGYEREESGTVAIKRNEKEDMGERREGVRKNGKFPGVKTVEEIRK